jgi:lysophospholipid acyltransferase (LPLAT)-like uncharacterized protein
MNALKRAQVALISGLGGALLTALMRTTRSETIAGHASEKMVFEDGVAAMLVLWHGRLLSSSFRYRHKGVATLITRSRDGDYIAGTIESWGFKVLRGSSSRGGTQSLRGIVRLLRSGTSVAVTPDGPRGPRQKMKVGPLYAAQMAGVPVIPAAASATHGHFFGSWDRFLVPRPFAWTPVAFGEPFRIDPAATEADLLRIAEDIEADLNRLTALVDEAARARR